MRVLIANRVSASSSAFICEICGSDFRIQANLTRYTEEFISHRSLNILRAVWHAQVIGGGAVIW